MQNMNRFRLKILGAHFSILSTQQKAALKQVLSEFTKLFDGTLGVYPHREFHIELEPGAKPRHPRPYPVPVNLLKTFKKR